MRAWVRFHQAIWLADRRWLRYVSILKPAINFGFRDAEKINDRIEFRVIWQVFAYFKRFRTNNLSDSLRRDCFLSDECSVDGLLRINSDFVTLICFLFRHGHIYTSVKNRCCGLQLNIYYLDISSVFSEWNSAIFSCIFCCSSRVSVL